VKLTPRSADDEAAFIALFDRTDDYAEHVDRLAQARKQFRTQTPAEVLKIVRRLRKDFESLKHIDFFPGDAFISAESAWADFEIAANVILSPDEPHAEARSIPRLSARDYQGRAWATRKHLWVDRVASAWLIQRFIDRDARFIWLDSPAQCPADALGFDFDDAAFTHIGDKVTFEVLMSSFGLEEDRGLLKIAALVHFLDVGGSAHQDATGFEAILSGARSRLNDDDALLREFSSVLDSLYIHYGKESSA
jgi:hypothetical protein